MDLVKMDLVKIAEAILEAQGETASIFEGPSTATVDGYTLLDIGWAEYSCGAACCGHYPEGYILLSPSGDKVKVAVAG